MYSCARTFGVWTKSAVCEEKSWQRYENLTNIRVHIPLCVSVINSMVRFAFFAFCYLLLFLFCFCLLRFIFFFRFLSAINSIPFASLVSAVVECLCLFFVFLPLFHYRGISSTPELLSLSCDHGLHCFVS